MKHNLSHNKLQALIISVLAASVLFFSLQKNMADNIEIISEDAIQTKGAEYHLDTILPTEISDEEVLKYEDGIHKIVTFDNNVSLYGIHNQNEVGNEMSVLITWGELKQIFDWDYLTTSGLSLTAYYFDVDYDGKKEVVVDIFVGGGTSVSYSELHIVKKFDEENQLVDYKLPYGISQKIKDQLSLKFTKNEVSILFGKERVDVLHNDVKELSNCAVLGNIVEYEVSKDTIVVVYGIGVTRRGESFIDYIAELSAEIEFCNGVYSARNFKIEKYG